jgi:colanic acid/amylovoran biosynthesis glycosyltransferase
VIRVVHSNPIWLPQTQTWIHTQVRNLPSNRVEAHIVCERTENLDQFRVQHLHNFAEASPLERLWDRGLRRLGVRRHLGYLARVALRLGAPLLHSHFGDAAWLNIPAARAAGCRHVASFYGYDMSFLPRQQTWRKRYEELFESADMFLCEGPYMAAQVVALGCPPDKMHVHHLGIALESLPFRPRGWSPGNPLKILIAATFTEKKGIPYALKALGRLQKHVGVEITLIGDARTESLESRLQKEEILRVISSEGLTNRVRMMGFQPYAAFLQEAYRHHIFLSPSVIARDGATEGGAPVSIAEAAATGMLVVSTRHCDIPELIRHGSTGLLAEERDVEGLLEQLLRAVREPDRWPAMLAAGRRRMEEEFNARTQAERLANLYESLLGRSADSGQRSTVAA